VNPDDGVCGDESVIALRQANSDASRKQLRHLICMHPSEWDASDLATRYAAVREPDQPLHDDEKWGKFEEHVQKLAFWTEAGLPERRVWHFHPLQFIRRFRSCAWLSEPELIQCLPRHFLAEHHASRTIYRASISLTQAQARTRGMRVELNKAMRKHGVATKQRQALFLANAIVESSYLAQYYEGGRGDGRPYGNWYGRGIIQVTWEENYLRYFRYRGRNTGNSADLTAWRDLIETDPLERCESAGFWWSRNVANRPASASAANEVWPAVICEDFDWQGRQCRGAVSRERRLLNPTLDSVARLVNTGSLTSTGRVNGLVERRDIFIHLQAVLMEVPYANPSNPSQFLTHPTFFTPQR
jgi:hydroxyethylthiazole kinase